jgi:hypothetical protein
MGPDIGAGAEVLVFLCLTVLQILVSLAVLSFTGHSFLDVFVDTAAGNDEVRWSKDPYHDWLFQFVFLVWLVAVWTVPATFLLKFLELPRPLFFVSLAGLLWLVFPVTLLSSLSAASSLVIFRGLILGLLLSHPGTLFRFYASTAPILAVCGFLAYVGVLGDYSVPLIPAAAAGAIGVFLYARLLGRLAWVTSLRKSSRRKPADPPRPEEADRIVTFDPWHVPEEKKPPAPSAPPLSLSEGERGGAEGAAPPLTPPHKKPSGKKLRRKLASRAYDPWAVPPPEPAPKTAKPPVIPAADPEDPYGPVAGTYELMASNAPLPGPVKEERVDPDLQGYTMLPAEAAATTPPPATPEISEYEARLAAPRKPPKLPPRPLLDGVYRFPFYPTTLGAMATVALGLLAVGFLLRLQIAFFPSAWK